VVFTAKENSFGTDNKVCASNLRSPAQPEVSLPNSGSDNPFYSDADEDLNRSSEFTDSDSEADYEIKDDNFIEQLVKWSVFLKQR